MNMWESLSEKTRENVLTKGIFWNNGLSKYLMHFICKIDEYSPFTKLIGAGRLLAKNNAPASSPGSSRPLCCTGKKKQALRGRKPRWLSVVQGDPFGSRCRPKQSIPGSMHLSAAQTYFGPEKAPLRAGTLAAPLLSSKEVNISY